jgi:3-oxoacyl-[acyl-carrier protein] reductase
METPLTHTQLLTNKRAVIFGAGGAVGTAVAKEFAAQGATVFLAGRTLRAVEQVAQEIHQDGGIAYAAQVDALDEQAVQAYLDRVAKEAGSIDILLNVMGPQPKDFSNGSNTQELPLEQFLLPLSTLVPSQFITARAAARHMVQQHSGVILFITAGLDMTKTPNVTAIGAAFAAMEALLRCLATDLGPAGVRVVGIRSGAMGETRTIQQGIERISKRRIKTASTPGTALEDGTSREMLTGSRTPCHIGLSLLLCVNIFYMLLFLWTLLSKGWQGLPT